MSEHEEIENAIAAWVLGATDPDEQEMISRHLEGCATCRAMVARFRSITDAVPLAVEEAEPDPRLRQRILAAATSGQAGGTATRSEIRTLRVPRQRPGRIAGQLFGRVPAAAAGALVLIALAAGLVVGDLAGRSASPAQPSQVARFSLVGHDSMGSAHATVLDLKSDGIAFVDFSGLPQLASGKVYELWLIGPTNRVDAAGVFIPDANGSKVVVVSRPLAGYVTMAVTSEQGPDGVAAPTQQPQLAGSIA
jgi:anti-sigma-K factor RskA